MAVVEKIGNGPRTGVRRPAGMDGRRGPAEIIILPCIRREALENAGRSAAPPR